MIIYLGKLNKLCEMCGKYGTFMYKDDKNTIKALFPEVNWEEQIICEGCAKRESGKKYWNKHKKKMSGGAPISIAHKVHIAPYSFSKKGKK